jgi:hypothetical protein
LKPTHSYGFKIWAVASDIIGSLYTAFPFVWMRSLLFLVLTIAKGEVFETALVGMAEVFSDNFYLLELHEANIDYCS